MIKKIDWYIIKKYISTTIFMVLVLSVISVVVDASEKTDDFVKSGLPAYKILTQYYAGFVPFIISMIFPLMSFIAVIFFTSKMAGRSEIVAILAGGVPYNRFLRPYFIGAVILGGTFWFASQYLIPKANVIRGDFQAKYIDSKSSYEIDQYNAKGNNYYIRVDTNSFAGLRGYDTSSKTANYGFFLQKISGNQVVYNLRADYLKWDTGRKQWTVQNAIERKISGNHEEVRMIQDTIVKLNVLPATIRPDKYLKDKMTTPELKAFIKAEETRGTEGLNDYRVERYRRDATPFSVFILALIGAVVASRKTRGGSGLHLAMGIVTAAIFVVMDKFSLTFSTKGDFPPALAAWTPNIVFSIIAVWLYRITPK